MFRTTLHGGDAVNGQQVFEQGIAQCLRCHVIDGTGGNVGPDLSTIGKDRTRESILESIVNPNAVIAEGFGASSYTLRSGEDIAGIPVEQTNELVTLRLADGTTRQIQKSQIESSTNPFSSMPPMVGVLNNSDLRDVVEFLSRQTSLEEAGH
jgi:putative heme-binding domain-containing protein